MTDNPDPTQDIVDNATVRAMASQWEVVGFDPADPFHAQLVLADPAELVVWVTLDPRTVKELSSSLAAVEAAQYEAVTGQARPQPTGPNVQPSVDNPDPSQEAPTDTIADDEHSGDTLPVPTRWTTVRCLRYGVFGLILLAMVYSFVAGGTRI